MSTPPPRRGLVAWVIYDWANSAFHTVILTFVFAAYFTREVVGDDIAGSQLWGTAIGLSGVAVALLGPLLGASTDVTGRRKPAFASFILLTVVATAMLWFVTPDPGSVWLGAGLAACGAFAIELSIILYNAMLADLAPRERTGRWSGWGWGVGYAGGLACLVAVLLLFIEEATRLPFLTTDDAIHVRATFVFVAVWMAVFSLPILLLTPDRQATGIPFARSVRLGIEQLVTSIREVRKYAPIVRFLVARIFYVDGLATMFAFGGVFAAGTFDMTPEEILKFAIALNITAGTGAIAFSWIDDCIGSRRTILIALAGLLLSGTALLLAPTVTVFWIAGMVLGIFVGPAQAASRSWLARAAPPELRNQMFGLFTFSGKATAFAGPLLVGWITVWSGSQRVGMSTIIVFIAIGFAILLTVPDAREA